MRRSILLACVAALVTGALAYLAPAVEIGPVDTGTLLVRLGFGVLVL